MIWALSLLIFLLPIYLLRFQLGIPTTALEIGIYLLTAALLITSRKTLKVFGGELKEKIKNWQWPVVLLLVAAIAAVGISSDKRAALGLLKAYFFDPLPIAAAIIILVKERVDYIKIIGAMGLTVIVLALLALGQYWGWLGVSGQWYQELPRRVTAVFAHPNALGLYVGPISALAGGLLLLDGALKRREKVFLGLVVGAGLVAIVLSLSRGALFGVMGALLLAGLVSRYRKWVLITAIVVLVASINYFPWKQKAVNLWRHQDASTNERVIILRATADILQKRWLTGVGLGGFGPLYDTQYRLANLSTHLYPHNIWLDFWVELGLMGLVAFGWLNIKFFQLARRLWHNKGESAALAGGLATAMGALLIHGLIDNPYFKNDLAVLFWVITGLLISLAGANAGRRGMSKER